MKLKDILKESIEAGRVYSNPFATAFVKENEESNSTEFTSEQRAVFLKAVNEYKKFGEAVYRKEGLEDVYESIKNLVEVAGSVTIKETGDWFDGVTVGRHMKRMNESFKVFEKTIKEVGTLQQRLESSYDEIGEVLGKYYEINNTDDELEEGNEFGASRAKAIANGDSEFEVDGKKYPVKSVDKDDKENAEEFVDESLVTEGRVPAKKLLQMVVKGNTKEVEGIKLSKEMAQSFLDWIQYSPFGKKYSQLPFHMLLKASFSWGLNRHADKKSKEYKDLEAASKRVKNESINESKYSIIDPKGNTAGTGTKDQANKRVKQLGGNKKGYFVVPAKSALKARRAMERFKFDFKNAKLQDKMSGLYFDDEMFGESVVNEAKYNYKQDAMNAYMKGKISAKELDRISKEDFKSSVATKKELQNFLDSGYMKSLMANTYGLKVPAMEKKVKGLMVFAESVNEGKFAGWIAGYNGKQIEIKKGEAKDLYNAKLLAIKKLKVPKSKVGLMFIKPAVDESVVNEAKYDIGMARKGNGLTVYNKAEEENGDYKTIAHIDNKGKVKYFDKKLPTNIKKEIEKEMVKMKESVAETKGNTMKLKSLIHESYGYGELPSEKLMKMKISAKDMLESVGEDDVKKSEEELSEGASSEEKRIVMLAVRKIAKYRNVPIDQSVVDVQRAADELERDIKKGKVKK